jgi:AraC-like DNA-binding protein
MGEVRSFQTPRHPASHADALSWSPADAAAAVPAVAAYRFASGAEPGGGSLARLRETFGRGFVRVEFQVLAAAHFSFSAALKILPGLAIASGSCTGALVRRTPELIADGNDHFIFVIAAAGIGFVSQSGRNKMLPPGEGILLSCANEGTLAFPDGGQFTGILVSRHGLSSLMTDPASALLKAIPKDAEALILLKGYLSAIDANGALFTSDPDLEAGRVVAEHTQQLLALALGSARDSLESAKRRLIPAVRLHAIKKDIAKLLAKPDLSVAAVADRHGVSPRYIQKLFESRGTTFSAFVLDRRLALAHRRLGDPAYADRTIIGIAFETGFSDLSYFNRCFRHRYGVAPSGLRPFAKAATHHGADAKKGERDSLWLNIPRESYREDLHMSDQDADAILSLVLNHATNYIWEEMDGQVLLYRVGAHKAVHLNDTAALIWRLCDGSRSLKDVIGVLGEAYPDMQDSIAADVRSGAQMLLKEGALVRTAMA